MTGELDFVETTAAIVVAYVAGNRLSSAELPDIIRSIHQSLVSLKKPPAKPAERPRPAVAMSKSITPDHLISLEDGKKYRSLTRHLGAHGMTPQQYRAKWGLPVDYPMVASSYSATRSQQAKNSGLGTTASRARAKAERNGGNR